MSGAGIITGIFAGIGLAAASGFRVFLPLFVLSLASKFDVLTLNEKFAWLGSDLAVIILGVATVVEIAAYLIPWLDHLLDAAALPLAGIAGTIAMASMLKGTDPALTYVDTCLDCRRRNGHCCTRLHHGYPRHLHSYHRRIGQSRF